jgi:hypothetical protein
MMVNILDMLGRAGAEAQKLDWGRILPAAGLAYAGGTTPGIAQGYNTMIARQKAEKQAQLANMLKLLAAGYTQFSPQTQRTQTAQQFLGGPMKLGAPPVSRQALPPLKAPQVGPIPSDVIKAGGLGFLKPLPKTGPSTAGKELSDYGWTKYAEALADPTKKNTVMKDATLAPYEKAYIMKNVKVEPPPAASTLNFGKLSDGGAELFTTAAQSLAGGADLATVIAAVSANKLVSENEKAFITSKLRAKSLADIIAELMSAQRKNNE